MRFLEKTFMLQVIDHHWKDHLLGMDHLRDGIGLRGYGQKDPLIEYKKRRVRSVRRHDGTHQVGYARTALPGAGRSTKESASAPPPPVISRPQPKLTLNRGEEPVATQTAQRSDDKVGRNDPCPCGSGKKYKKCHGA